jgi:Fe2+ or Zn2+ uptake regulation protein
MNTEADEYLREHDIKPSFQRIKIFKYLVSKKNHPSADTIYKELVGEIPTLSKTTVYNTLKLFVEKKAAIVLQMSDSEDRFDADVSLHGHFRCEKCKNIYDFKVASKVLKYMKLDDFLINEIQVSCIGICSNCKNK